MNPRSKRFLAPCLFGVGLVFGAGCGDRRETEKRELLTRIEAISIEATFEERRAQIAHLESLPLVTPEFEEVRSLCAKAHAALLQAEDAQGRVRAVLADPDVVPSADEQTQAVRALRDSSAALAEARELLPRCETKRNALRAPHR